MLSGVKALVLVISRLLRGPLFTCPHSTWHHGVVKAADSRLDLAHVCVSPKFYMLTSKPQCDGLSRWGLEELIRSRGRSPHAGMSVLIKETLGSSVTLPTFEDREKTAACEPRRGPPPDTESARALPLNFQPLAR